MSQAAWSAEFYRAAISEPPAARAVGRCRASRQTFPQAGDERMPAAHTLTRPSRLARMTSDASPGRFAAVMATGIRSVALALAGSAAISRVMLWLAAPGSGPAAALSIVGWISWLSLTVLIGARLEGRSRARPALADVKGTWYLFVVATQSLAIAATLPAADGLLPVRQAAYLGLTAWGAGLLLYLATTGVVLARLHRFGPPSAGERAGCMGSAVPARHVRSSRYRA